MDSKDIGQDLLMQMFQYDLMNVQRMRNYSDLMCLINPHTLPFFGKGD